MNLLNISALAMLDTLRQFKIWVLLWFFNALFALTILLPVAMLIFRLLGHSLESDQLLRNQFSIFLGDSISQLAIRLPENISLPILLSFLYIILWIFLNGGILHSLHQDERPNFIRFAQGAVSYASPFTIVFILSSFSLFIFCIVPNFVLSSLISTIHEKVENPFWMTYLRLFKNIFLFTILHFILMVFDYSKIIIVTKELRFSFQVILDSLTFCIHRFKWVVIVYFVILLLAFIIYLVSVFVLSLIKSTDMMSILAGFSIQQLCILLLMGTRILHYASGRRLYLCLSSRIV